MNTNKIQELMHIENIQDCDNSWSDLDSFNKNKVVMNINIVAEAYDKYKIALSQAKLLKTEEAWNLAREKNIIFDNEFAKANIQLDEAEKEKNEPARKFSFEAMYAECELVRFNKKGDMK